MATIYFLSNSFMPGVLAITRIDPEVLAQKPPFKFEVISKYQTYDSCEILPSFKERLTEFRISDEDVYYGVDPMVAEAELKVIVFGAGGEFGPETKLLECSEHDESDFHVSDRPHLPEDLTPSEIELMELKMAYQSHLEEREALAALEKQKEQLAERERIAKLEVLNLKAKMAGYKSYEDQKNEKKRLKDEAKRLKDEANLRKIKEEADRERLENIARTEGYQNLTHKIFFQSLGKDMVDEIINLDERIVVLRNYIAENNNRPSKTAARKMAQLSNHEAKLEKIIANNPGLSIYLESCK